MTVEILVPKLGMGVEELELVKWYKNEGETVKKGEPLVQVMTSKITNDIEAPANGVLKKTYAQEGDTIKPNQKIGEIETEE
ncbi:hypothetical protein X927_05440 [Petrotoga mexicana DSM 14811]|uniref:Lipoyl-binding domain-containing protein n=1 Tax=Petrotoga mexicana DSM 14811 TaxID=1122954 RepID=A0A2K1P9L3_9BACT|nr:biotin/lipoyl-containing protein [Petrotoga mexicana]PNR99479.1 hypothetical protein X927_05440 [Petrotoga mexicana DSM 14811]